MPINFDQLNAYQISQLNYASLSDEDRRGLIAVAMAAGGKYKREAAQEVIESAIGRKVPWDKIHKGIITNQPSPEYESILQFGRKEAGKAKGMDVFERLHKNLPRPQSPPPQRGTERTPQPYGNIGAGRVDIPGNLPGNVSAQEQADIDAAIRASQQQGASSSSSNLPPAGVTNPNLPGQNVASNVAGPSEPQNPNPQGSDVASNVAGPSEPQGPPPGIARSYQHATKGKITAEQDEIIKKHGSQLADLDFWKLTDPQIRVLIAKGLFGSDPDRRGAQSVFKKAFPNAVFDWDIGKDLKKYPDKALSKAVNDFGAQIRSVTKANPHLHPSSHDSDNPPLSPQSDDVSQSVKDMYKGEKESGKAEESEVGGPEGEGPEVGGPAGAAFVRGQQRGKLSYPGPKINIPFHVFQGKSGILPDNVLLAMPDDLLSNLNATDKAAMEKRRAALQQDEQKLLGMKDGPYRAYVQQRGDEIKRQWNYYRDMAPASESQTTRPKEIPGMPFHAIGGTEPAGIWERMWHGYHGTIAGIPVLLAAKAGIPLPAGTGNFEKDMEILSRQYTPEEINDLRNYAREAFDVFVRNTSPIERSNLAKLQEAIPDFLATVENTIPAPNINPNLPPLPEFGGIKGPRKVTGQLPAAPPLTPLGRQLAPETISPIEQQRIPTPQPPAAAGISQEALRKELSGARGELARMGQERMAGLGALLGEMAAAREQEQPRLRAIGEKLGVIPGRVATIEDVLEPDDKLPEGGPAVPEADRKLHVPAAHEADFMSWMNANGIMDELRLLYNEQVMAQQNAPGSERLGQIPSFEDWFYGGGARDYLSHFYDEFMTAQYPTYPEGREAYMRSQQYNAQHPEVPDIEEQLARNPARFPAPYRVGKLPPVAPFEEQLPPAPQQPLPMPFEETRPTPGPLYPGGIGAIVGEAERSFRERTLPTIAERFASVGGIGSSAFRGSLLEAGRRFEREMAAFAREQQREEEKLNLQRALQERQRVETQNALLAEREALAGRHGVQYGELQQRRAQTAREQQLAREREIQQRAREQQGLGLRQTEVGTNLARQAATTEQARIGTLAQTELGRNIAQGELASRFGGLGVQRGELGLRGQEAQAQAEARRGALISGAQQAGTALGMTQAQMAEQLRQGQVGQQLQQYGIHSGIPAQQVPRAEGNVATALGVLEPLAKTATAYFLG